jgi:uncharacterized membrane protein YdjX (TVP38/TMEM64 family)
MYQFCMAVAGRIFSVRKTGLREEQYKKIGATIFTTGLFCGSVALFVASFLARAEISKNVGGVLGQVFGFTLAMLAFFAASASMFLTFRLARGVIRSFYK